VALTAFDSGDFRDMALAAGCNSYVTKPVDFELLESVIGDHLSRPSVPVLA
jgi:DNA-binding response OmpR family regulator